MTMYLPPQFTARDRDQALALMREHPFASLISVQDDGLPFVTHLPLHVVEGDESRSASLLGHVARPNPHWKLLAERPHALVTFVGPQAYMSPSVYADSERVPTWNYLAVHCTVQARLLDLEADKDALLKALIGDHEPPYADQWRSLRPEYQQAMLRGIVAFELVIERLDCKLKLNQHRPEAHAAMHAQYAAGDADMQALAVWMERLGLVPRA